MPAKNDSNEIAKIGEFGLIELLTKEISLSNSSSIVGVGDDAAVLDMNGLQTVVTSDLLTEGIHFDLMYTPLKHLGYKAVVVNLSDVYAMNAIPSQIIVSIAISAKFSTDLIEEIYEGIHLACETYGVDLVGGDTSSSLTGLTISITALGSAPKEKLVYRSGAKENDLICVTGDLGGAYLGLQLLEREKVIFEKSKDVQPDLSGFDYVLERQLKPEAREDIINLFAGKEIQPTSMIDISDGLSSELLHICKASKKGCKIYADKIPISPDTKQAAEELNLEPLTTSLNGGEDYELLFTLPIKDHDKVSMLPGVSVIGHILSEQDGRYLSMSDGTLVELMALGWNSIVE